MTNIIMAMGQASGDSIAMLVIQTMTEQSRMGSKEGWLRKMPNQTALVWGRCTFSHTVYRPQDLAPALAQAVAVLGGARPRIQGSED